MAQADFTPNIVLQNPAVRKVANVAVGSALIVLPALAIVEAYSALSFAAWLPAATAVTSFLAGVFGLAVITPNIPTQRTDAKVLGEAPAEPMPEANEHGYADDGTGITVDIDRDGDALDGSINIETGETYSADLPSRQDLRKQAE